MTLQELMEAEQRELAACDQILSFARAEGRVDENDDPNLTPEETDKLASHTEKAQEYRAGIEQYNERKAALARWRQAREAHASQPAQPERRETGHTADIRIPAVPRNPEEEGKNGFRSFGEFLHSVKAAGESNNTAVDDRLRIGAVTSGGASTYSGPDGGFLAPTTFAQGIWEGVMREDPLNLVPRCDVRQITGRSVKFNADAETSRADGSRHGGIRGYWMEEGGTFTTSKPTYRQLEVKPKKLGVFAYMTEELMDDAPAASQHLEYTAGAEISYMLNRSIVAGSGAGQPLGIINSAGIETVAVETGQTSNESLLAANIDKMYARLLPGSLSGAVWLIHPSLQPALQKLGREVGVGGVPAYMPPGGLSATPYGMLKGLPVLSCEYCKAANTTGDIILANLRGYILGTKGGLRAESSIHVAFTTDELAFRFIVKADGQPWRASPVTLENQSGSETFADFVLLATRS